MTYGRLLGESSTRFFRRHRAQLLFSVLGVALGVAGVLAIDLATGSARAAFRTSAETVSGRATHEITSRIGLIDDSLVARLRREVGLTAVAPVVEGFASSPRLPGASLRILGVDPFSEAPFRSFVAQGSTASGRAVSELDVGTFVTVPYAVVLSAETAARAGVSLGDSLPVVVAGRTWRLPVAGTLAATDRLTRSGLTDVLLMDVSSAQEVLGTIGGLSRIDLALTDSPEDSTRLRRVEALLGPDEILTTAGTRADAMAGMIDAFEINLTALSLLALVFGMFLIYNSVTFSVVQRRRILGLLRTVGVTRGEVVRLILREAAWIGCVGTVLGLAGGFLLSRTLVQMVTRTINDLYFVVAVEGISPDMVLYVKAAALGLGATLLASLPPALEAASAEPRLGTLRSVSEQGARTGVPRAALLGLFLLTVGGVVLTVSRRNLTLSFVALFLVVAGLALLTPQAAVILLQLLGPPLHRVGGIVGRLATRGVLASLSRTAPAIAALVVAISVTVALGVMIQSFRVSLVRWLDATLVADVYVSLPGPTASRATGTLSPALVSRFTTHPSVVAYSTYRGADLLGNEGELRLVALDLDPRGETAFEFLSGDASQTMRAFQAGDGLLVSEPFAFQRDLAVGDSVTLPTSVGPRRLPVLGVFRDYGSDRGTAMLSRGLYDRLFDDPGVTSLALYLESGSVSEDVVAELLRDVPEGTTVTVRSHDSLRAGSLEVFDRTFEVTRVLRWLAFIVAFVGVLAALMALELERTRELGTMRAWGMTPGEVWALVVTQTGIMGLVSGLLSLPIGLALSLIMIFVVNKRSFGWTLNLHVGPGVMAQALALAFVAALLAGAYPAWRMSRTSPSVALRAE